MNVLLITLLPLEVILGTLTVLNFFALFPINFYKFTELPSDVRGEITNHADEIIDDYKDRVQRRETKKSFASTLYLHFHIQRCEPDEKAPSPKKPWPSGVVYYHCASQAALDWCSEDMVIYKTTETKRRINRGQEVSIGVSCYRTNEFTRLLHDYDEFLVRAVCCTFPFLLLLKLYRLMYYKEENEAVAEEENQEENEPQPVVRNRRNAAPPDVPPPPRRNIVNRHENFRRRRS